MVVGGDGSNCDGDQSWLMLVIGSVDGGDWTIYGDW